MNDTLKECPFCGGEAIVHRNGLATRWAASCTGCGCSPLTHNARTEAEAIAAWNARKSPRTDMGDEWQDIASAPKDGTRVLVGCFREGAQKFGRVCVDRWHTGSPSHYTGWGRFSERYFPATHWRPLPAPPALRTGEATDV